MEHNYLKSPLSTPSIVRKVLLSWILSAAIENTLVPGPLSNLSTLADMSFLRLVILTAVIFAVLLIGRKYISSAIERWAMVGSFLWLAIISLVTSYTFPLLFACCLIFAILFIYALRGWKWQHREPSPSPQYKPIWGWITAILAILFFLFVSIWTVCRVISFCAPTYDFGIFSQMFHSMKTTGLPLTTLERDGILSHFKVHVSPIYYLLLPFYMFVPRPETLQVLQAAVLTSAVIPLWLLGKQRKLSPAIRTALCALLLLYPAYSGGASYDIHENAFLTPLILWLLYALDSRRNLLVCVFTVLVLMVKEDAAVYCAVIALYVIIRSLLVTAHRSQLLLGCLMMAFSIGWFLAVTKYLAFSGDGVMTYRYDNFIYDGSSSLLTVIKAVILCPMKAVYECVDAEKLKFIGYTLLPLLGIPLITRKYERYVLLIPYILVNLMSDYQYQHDIFFQYTYGSTAFLFYLVLVNLCDINTNAIRNSILVFATAVSLFCFVDTVIPKAIPYPKYCSENAQYYKQVRETLDTIPDDASVGATTFYTTYLSQRETLYDIRYASTEHLLSCEYVVLTTTSENCYKAYAVNGENGLNNLILLLDSNDYSVFAELPGSLIIYRRN